MIITGSIGMGKSTVAGMLRQRGYAVFDADAAVHQLYAGGPAVAVIGDAFPGTVVNGAVDRTLLAEAIAGQPDAFRRLEAIVHPKVRELERRFAGLERGKANRPLCFEIPLWFELGRDHADTPYPVIVVSAPAAVQRARVLARPGMTEARLNELLARQVSDAEKRAKADYVIETGGTLAQTEAELDAVLARIANDRAARDRGQ